MFVYSYVFCVLLSHSADCLSLRNTAKKKKRTETIEICQSPWLQTDLPGTAYSFLWFILDDKFGVTIVIDNVPVESSEMIHNLFSLELLLLEWLHMSTVNIAGVSAEHYFGQLKNMTSAKIA